MGVEDEAFCFYVFDSQKAMWIMLLLLRGRIERLRPCLFKEFFAGILDSIGSSDFGLVSPREERYVSEKSFGSSGFGLVSPKP